MNAIKKLSQALVMPVMSVGLVMGGTAEAQSGTETRVAVNARETKYAPSADGVPLNEKILTKEERDRLTPDQIIEMLKAGNDRFMKNEVTSRDHSELVRKAATGQHPKAVVLSCIDSRVPIEDVFDRGIGDVFVARVAGNFANNDIIGSMEFGCAVAGAKLILVLGHEHCGAVKGAIDKVEMGHLTSLLSNIRPAVDQLHLYSGEKTSRNQEFVHLVAEKNVELTIQNIRRQSSILADLEKQGNLKIVGAMYDMDTGKVTFSSE